MGFRIGTRVFLENTKLEILFEKNSEITKIFHFLNFPAVKLAINTILLKFIIFILQSFKEVLELKLVVFRIKTYFKFSTDLLLVGKIFGNMKTI